MKTINLANLGLKSTGKKVKIALVGSGVNPWHSHVGKIAGGAKFYYDDNGQISQDTEDIFDNIGHGTACAGVIRQQAPDAELYSLKIFNNDLSAYSDLLIEAINWSIANNMDIINLSLGTQSPNSFKQLEQACSKAYNQGIIIVAANKTLDEKSYPAALPETIGVCAHPDCTEDTIFSNPDSPINFLAHGFPRTLPGSFKEDAFKRSSFAAGRLTGIIAALKEKYPKHHTEDIKQFFRDY